MFATISDENNLLTEDDAHAIIHAAWTKYQPETHGWNGEGRDAAAADETRADVGTHAQSDMYTKISTDAFIRVMESRKSSN